LRTAVDVPLPKINPTAIVGGVEVANEPRK
jgi:hypothetical protein